MKYIHQKRNGITGKTIEMKYYWTVEHNCGNFLYWKSEDENDFLKRAKGFYCDKEFGYGETIEDSYKRNRKHEE